MSSPGRSNRGSASPPQVFPIRAGGLHGACPPAPRPLAASKPTGHKAKGGVCLLPQAMSPDGEAIVTGAGDETLRFWNVFSKTRSTKVKWVGISARCSPTRVPQPVPGPHESPGQRRLPRQLWSPLGPPMSPFCSRIATQPRPHGRRCSESRSPTRLRVLGTVPTGSPGPKPRMPSRQKSLIVLVLRGARPQWSGPADPDHRGGRPRGCGLVLSPVCPAGVCVSPQPLHQDPVKSRASPSVSAESHLSSACMDPPLPSTQSPEDAAGAGGESGLEDPEDSH